jgi:hypothetical protein
VKSIKIESFKAKTKNLQFYYIIYALITGKFITKLVELHNVEEKTKIHAKAYEAKFSIAKKLIAHSIKEERDWVVILQQSFDELIRFNEFTQDENWSQHCLKYSSVGDSTDILQVKEKLLVVPERINFTALSEYINSIPSEYRKNSLARIFSSRILIKGDCNFEYYCGDETALFIHFCKLFDIPMSIQDIYSELISARISPINTTINFSRYYKTRYFASIFQDSPIEKFKIHFEALRSKAPINISYLKRFFERLSKHILGKCHRIMLINSVTKFEAQDPRVNKLFIEWYHCNTFIKMNNNNNYRDSYSDRKKTKIELEIKVFQKYDETKTES